MSLRSAHNTLFVGAHNIITTLRQQLALFELWTAFETFVIQVIVPSTAWAKSGRVGATHTALG